MNQWRIYCDIVGENPDCLDTMGYPLPVDRVTHLIVSYVTVQCGVRMLSP